MMEVLNIVVVKNTVNFKMVKAASQFQFSDSLAQNLQPISN